MPGDAGDTAAGGRTLTLAGVALPDQPHHQGGAVAALRGAGEGLDAELVSSGLEEEQREGEAQAGRRCLRVSVTASTSDLGTISKSRKRASVPCGTRAPGSAEQGPVVTPARGAGAGRRARVLQGDSPQTAGPRGWRLCRRSRLEPPGGRPPPAAPARRTRHAQETTSSVLPTARAGGPLSLGRRDT